MEDKLNDIKQDYKNITIPKELNNMIDETIKKASRDLRKKRIKIGKGLKVAFTTLVICCMFILAINTNETFAKSLANIPILNQIANVFTFVNYEHKTDAITENIVIPQVKGLGDKDFEAKINNHIQTKINEIIINAELRADGYKKAYFETGGTKEDYYPIVFKLNYEKKYVDDTILSFIIYHGETLAPAYTKTYYYNIDLKNNKDITLEDMLGEDYINIANKSIRKQIKELQDNPDENKKYGFMVDNLDSISINENQDFYINDEKKVVVVFKKYAIADGATGPVEFVIE